MRGRNATLAAPLILYCVLPGTDDMAPANKVSVMQAVFVGNDDHSPSPLSPTVEGSTLTCSSARAEGPGLTHFMGSADDGGSAAAGLDDGASESIGGAAAPSVCLGVVNDAGAVHSNSLTDAVARRRRVDPAVVAGPLIRYESTN